MAKRIEKTEEKFGHSRPKLSDVRGEVASGAAIMVARADTRKEALEAVEKQLSFEQFMNHCVQELKKQFEIYPEKIQTAKDFLEGKAPIKLRVPLAPYRSVFQESEEYKDRLSTLEFRILTSLKEKKSALTMAYLGIPYPLSGRWTVDLTVNAETVELTLGVEGKGPSSEAIGGFSVTEEANTQVINFNEASKPIEEWIPLSKDEIEASRKKVAWLKSVLRNLQDRNGKVLVSLDIKGLLPPTLLDQLHSWQDEYKKPNPYCPEDEKDNFLKGLEAFEASLAYLAMRETRDIEAKGETLKGVHCPGITVKCLKEYGFGYERSFKKDGYTFYLLPLGNDGGVKNCLFYVYDGKTLFPRLAYYSRSHQRWRVDAYHSNEVYQRGERSKGIHSYTAETIPCPELETQLLDLEGAGAPRDGNKYELDSFDPEANTYAKEIALDAITGVTCEEREMAVGTEGKKAKDFLKDYFPKNFIPDFSQAPLETTNRPKSRFFPEGFTTEKYKFNYQGDDLEITMAHDPSGQVWVDCVRRANIPVNSYGIPSKVLTLGPLQWKPFEYSGQISPNFERYTDPFLDNVGREDYRNITRLLDLLPIIQEFRKKKGIKRDKKK